jgi:hypothetical protein
MCVDGVLNIGIGGGWPVVLSFHEVRRYGSICVGGVPKMGSPTGGLPALIV